jgi:hypothetical protein
LKTFLCLSRARLSIPGNSNSEENVNFVVAVLYVYAGGSPDQEERDYDR